MRKLIISAAVTAALASPVAVSTAYAQAAAAPAPAPSPFTFNVGAVSDYLFRGVSQTRGNPALQAGVDYAHASGFYLGAWISNVTWVKDFLGSGSTEIDVYGGYKNAFAGGDWNYDVGYITYNYPGSGSAIPTVLAKPATQELYGAIGYKWVTAKYSYATSTNFIGWYGGSALDKNTRGSDYIELNANYDMGSGWTLIGHMGQQRVQNSVQTAGGVNSANYGDWKIGVTKDVGFGVVGLSYSDTNANGSCNNSTGGTSAYCWASGNFVSGVGPSSNFRNAAQGTAVLSFLKTF